MATLFLVHRTRIQYWIENDTFSYQVYRSRTFLQPWLSLLYAQRYIWLIPARPTATQYHKNSNNHKSKRVWPKTICLFPARPSARQQDRDGDNVPRRTEPDTAPSRAAPRVQRRAPPHRHASAAEHRQKWVVGGKAGILSTSRNCSLYTGCWGELGRKVG